MTQSDTLGVGLLHLGFMVGPASQCSAMVFLGRLKQYSATNVLAASSHRPAVWKWGVG